ncbi:MAG TPA: TolC family outer membrane protein [Ramlibacter sp.]|uniref:TolC family outer membrane protein n=1 Tax=Ramlibacter sp. TaxID=1917967 RepID=UPI002BE14ADA|nr:TolC family outer membrane protein [Ramlibacter sp.]HVZ46633.1 TolC family outer membrane protein [Ramlibacter sp.]
MRSMRLISMPLAFAAVFAPAARAESLLALYDLAKAQDATWQSARSQYDANLARAEQARAGLLPTVGLSAGISRSAIDIDVPPTDREYTTQGASISASQPLYRPANLATYRQAKWQADQAAQQLKQASQDLIVRVSQAYFDVLAAQDTLAFVQAQKAAVAEQLASAKRNFEVGTSTITDTREAQARYDLVIAQEIAADNDLRVKKLALDTLVGKADAKPDPIAAPMSVPPPQPADPQAWVQQAETASPAIEQARAAVEIAGLEVEKARAGHKPTVDLTANYGWQRNLEGNSSTPFTFTPKSGTVGVTFNMPLFSGFAVENRVRETLSLEDKAKSDLDATRRSVAQQVRTAYFGVVSGQSQVKALEAAEASSQSALDANRLGYQVGVRINIDVLNAQSQLYQTKRDLAQARYNVLLGHLKLRQANGTLEEGDVARLNTLVVK